MDKLKFILKVLVAFIGISMIVGLIYLIMWLVHGYSIARLLLLGSVILWASIEVVKGLE